MAPSPLNSLSDLIDRVPQLASARDYGVGFVQGIGNFEEVRKSSQVIEVEKLEFYVLIIDALIKSKKAMNRSHDREAIIQLEAIKKIREHQNFRVRG
jgi:hypothetical protein